MLVDIRGLSSVELKEAIVDLGEKPFRAKQLEEWVWTKSASSFDEMTNLSLQFREALKEKFYLKRKLFFWALFLCFPIQIVLTVIVNLFGNNYVSNILNFGMLIYFIWLWSVFDCEIFKLNSLWQIMLARILFVIISFGVIFTL